MSFHGLVNLVKSVQAELMNVKATPGSLKGNLLLKQKDRQGGEKDQKTPAPKNSSSWAIITGPTNGIGKEFAIELSKAGFNLFLIGRNPNKLTSLQDELMKVNPTIEVEIETIDLSDNNPGGRAAPTSILINNAGLSHSEPIEFQMNDLDQDINSLLNVNVFSVLYLTKLVLPFMLPYKKV
ncbi:hypothetical protein PGT21_026080 [Puccinia graminis f. sp. tritici]|uniref:Uncharacterized protein n=1 Tax=Puccinia graminis f. sp. tritici TaxID=56615 RepID=A0A5B0QBT2_PUCGR|nr:hypothetical protein PGT21_026080 [Puccinia graminis f. sp. tritici]